MWPFLFTCNTLDELLLHPDQPAPAFKGHLSQRNCVLLRIDKTHLETFKNIYKSQATAKTAALVFSIPVTSSILYIVIQNANNKAQGIWTALDALKLTFKSASQLTWCSTDLKKLIVQQCQIFALNATKAGLPRQLQGWAVGCQWHNYSAANHVCWMHEWWLLRNLRLLQ